MGTGQRFHLPLPPSFKRSKSAAQDRGWQAEGREFKAQHTLGSPESTLKTTRNQSISSSVTAKVPALSFSDATTELGSSHLSTEKPDTAPDLQLKASSVLLHEEFRFGADVVSSTHSRRLKVYGSSSTLNSHYDAQRAPLAVSQQTSDSSRRDFALRKGSPVVVKSTTPDKDSRRQFRLFRLSKAEHKSETKEAAKFPAAMGIGSKRSSTVAGYSVTAGSSGHSPASKQPLNPQKDVRLNRNSTSYQKLNQVSLPKAIGPDAPRVKVNIRRPRVGVKHWFDGLEGDSSEDEVVDEPELQPSFVAGMELAFQGGRIGPISKEENHVSTSTAKSSSRRTEESVYSKQPKTPPRHMLPVSAIPPRVSTLNAKSSRSTLSNKGSQWAGSKPKANSLASTDLHHTSILDLSSSDDDEPPPDGRDSPNVRLPQLRDSIAVESLLESDIEIGTAKAISTRHGAPTQPAPSVQRVPGAHSQRSGRASLKNHNMRSNHRLTYLSDQSSGPTPEESDLLTSFPATPIDQSISRRVSLQDHCLPDNASIESRRLMSVTRQEESLLAAMRLKKAALNHAGASTTDRRVQALIEADRKSMRQPLQPQRNSVSSDTTWSSHQRKHEVRQSVNLDRNLDQVSFPTFQTGFSNEPGARSSLASFQTGTSMEPDTEAFSSSTAASPTLLSPSNGFGRTSRSTFFSTSTSDSRDTSRSRREIHHLATLEKLQQVPKRDEVASQDFIDWPYRGWEARAKITLAH